MSSQYEPSPFARKARIMSKKIRNCLKCGQPFQSTGPGNRICPKSTCNQTNSRQTTVPSASAPSGRVIRRSVGEQ